MLNSMTPQEWDEWQAYYRVEPWDASLLWKYFSELLATIPNVSGRVKRYYRQEDFLPRRAVKEEPVSSDDLWKRFKMWVSPKKG